MWCLIVSIPDLCPIPYFELVGGCPGKFLKIYVPENAFQAILKPIFPYSINSILSKVRHSNTLFLMTGPRSAVGNVSGYRCVSDCNPGVASSIPARSHTFMEIDHEIISTVILLPSADSFKKGCCQLQAKVCARITGYPLVQACPGKVWLGELTVPQ